MLGHKTIATSTDKENAAGNSKVYSKRGENTGGLGVIEGQLGDASVWPHSGSQRDKEFQPRQLMKLPRRLLGKTH